MFGREKELTAEQRDLIEKETRVLPPPEALFVRQQGPITLTYLDSTHVIKRLNTIFGVAGWSHSVDDEKLLYETETDGKWKCSYKCTVTIYTSFGISHTDLGVGHGISKDRGKALEGAILEAPTDAMKRAARYFGESLGLALYSELDRTEIFLQSIAAVTDIAGFNKIRDTLSKLKASFNDSQYVVLAHSLAEKKKGLDV